MKKISKLILTLVIIPSLLMGCNLESTQDIEEPVSEYQELEVNNISYDKDNKKLSFIINNNSKSSVYFGYQYYIEKKNNTWEKTNLTDNLFFIEIALEISPGKSQENSIDLSSIEPLKKGVYRIVRDYNNEDGKITQYIQFNVEDENLSNFTSYNTINKN